MLRACSAHIVHFVCVAVLQICVSKVSLEINPLHLVFNESPEERERGIRRRRRDWWGGVKASVFSCGHFTITKLTRVRWAMARQQGDQSAATSIRTNCPDYTAAIS